MSTTFIVSITLLSGLIILVAAAISHFGGK